MQFLMMLLVSFSLFATTKKEVVYGEDNRVDVYASTQSAYVEYSRATAAMVPNILLHATGKETIIRSASLTERGICADQKFAAQPTAARCSGFLISENVLVTAGHCIRNDADCKINRWIFDYKIDHADQVKVKVPNKSVFTCKKILGRMFEENDGTDYAVIELTKKVTDRRPLTFRKSGKIEPGTSLVVIGHPSGLPTKIADGAKVRSVNDKFFVADLDTFGGNSGSAVINTKTGEVEGILVRGETDYIDNEARGCKEVNTCLQDDCRGEDVQDITHVTVIQTP